MPYPLKGEKKSDYIDRAVDYMVHQEGMTIKAALGKAYGMWRGKKGHG